MKSVAPNPSEPADDFDHDNPFCVDVEGFEGPLHLLLELARKQKVNLRCVSVLQLATQYLAFIEDACDRRIDLAAEYLLMAAWLAYLKSRLLLPESELGTLQESSAEDDAQRLAFRLKRLQAMREASAHLFDLNLLGRDVFLRGAPQQPKVSKTRTYDTSLWHLTQAFGAMRARKARQAPHMIESQYVLPLEQARERLRTLSRDLTDWADLEDIRERVTSTQSDLPGHSVMASVFSASLELARDGDIDIRQNGSFAPIYVRGLAA